MNYFEAIIAQCQRRIDRIRSNPDPTKLRINELMYLSEMESAQEWLEIWKRGDRLCGTMDQAQIFAAMGFRNPPYLGAGNRSNVMKKNYFDILRQHGLPDQTCDMTILPLAMCVEGDLPWPHVVSVWNHACDRETDMLFTAISTYCGCPQFKLDLPLATDYEAVRYCADQLGELIEWVEWKFPGVKMDWEHLEKDIGLENERTKLKREQFELRKCVPAPISGQDVFRLGGGRGDDKDPLKWLRLQTEEIANRAAKHIGSVEGEEKLRIAWLATGPFGSNVFDMLHRKGVSIPWFQHGFTCDEFGYHDWADFGYYGDTNEYKRKLTPLEEIARHNLHNGWGGRGLERWVASVRDVCRDLKIDAVVQFLHTGCVTTGGLAEITKQVLEKELGVSVLNIQGRQNDWNQEQERQFLKDVGEFVDLCIANKK